AGPERAPELPLGHQAVLVGVAAHVGQVVPPADADEDVAVGGDHPAPAPLPVLFGGVPGRHHVHLLASARFAFPHAQPASAPGAAAPGGRPKLPGVTIPSGYTLAVRSAIVLASPLRSVGSPVAGHDERSRWGRVAGVRPGVA